MARPTAFSSININKTPLAVTGGVLSVSGKPLLLTSGAQDIAHSGQKFKFGVSGINYTRITAGSNYDFTIYDSAFDPTIAIDVNTRTLYVDNVGAVPTIDWGGRRMYGYHDSLTRQSVDWQNCRLYQPFFDGVECLNWAQGDLYDNNGFHAANWMGRVLRDENEDITLDWHNRTLKGGVWNLSHAPVATGDITTKKYVDDLNKSGLAGTPILLNTTSIPNDSVLAWTFFSGKFQWGSKPRLSFSDLTRVYNASNDIVVDGQSHSMNYVFQSVSYPIVNWELQYINSFDDRYDGGTSTYSPIARKSIDWRNRQLVSYSVSDSPIVTVDWQQKKLHGSNSVTSVDWENKTLHDVVGSTVLNWSTKTMAGRWAISSVLKTNTAVTSSINWNTSDSFSRTLTANTTFTFSTAPTSSTTCQKITVAITNPSSYTVTWPAGIKWQGGVTPTQTVGTGPLPKTDIYEFTAIGTTIYGSVSQNHF